MPRPGAIICAAALVLGLGGAVAADGLQGRPVTFRILTYNQPEAPIFSGSLHRAVIGPGPEFGLGHEGAQNELDVVPILVDIGDTRIGISYAKAGSGELWQARFNGYVLRFPGDCFPLAAVAIDAAGTNLAIDNKRVRLADRALTIDVAGLRYDPGSRISLDLVPAPCGGTG